MGARKRRRSKRARSALRPSQECSYFNCISRGDGPVDPRRSAANIAKLLTNTRTTDIAALNGMPNALGAQGWELVSAILIFKRPGGYCATGTRRWVAASAITSRPFQINASSGAPKYDGAPVTLPFMRWLKKIA